MFCKGKSIFVERGMEALTHFSATIGLVENMEKSNLFLVGMTEEVVKKL